MSSCSTINKFQKEHEEDFKVTINVDDSKILSYDSEKMMELILPNGVLMIYIVHMYRVFQ